MVYEIRDGDEVLSNLSAQEALAKLEAMIEAGRDPYLYDSYGDPMGRFELEAIVNA